MDGQLFTQKQIADIACRMAINTKMVLTSDEAAIYMGISKSHLYKLTMRREIPCYKPTGKMCYFNRSELEDWLQRNRCSTDEELTDKALRYTHWGKDKRVSPASR